MAKQRQPNGQATELEYLQYFYHNVGQCLGPADGEIYNELKLLFREGTGKDLPTGYEPWDEEEEEVVNG